MGEFLIIAGMSGAGRSTAADVLEDQGWFVIDNLPAALVPKVAELAERPSSEAERVALVVGRGGGEYVDEVTPAVADLRSSGLGLTVLFLDASDEVLVRRFEGTRRRHPLAGEGVVEAIALERRMLEPIKTFADVVVDTTDLNVHQLRARLVELFGRGQATGAMQITVVSFGYKFGLPLDADMVLDCRFLPNPHWVEELRPLTGRNPEVVSYVLGQPDTKVFLDRVEELLELLLPAFLREGKSYLSIGVGCTGGRHRSVTVADEIARRITSQGFEPVVSHRDIDR